MGESSSNYIIEILIYLVMIQSFKYDSSHTILSIVLRKYYSHLNQNKTEQKGKNYDKTSKRI